jgi:hypothetical protein
MATKLTWGFARSQSLPAVGSRRFGDWVVTLRIDLTGFDALRGSDKGVGCCLGPSPSRYTGGSLYSASAKKPTFFRMRREVEVVVIEEAGD